MAELLADQFTVIAYDRRGNGRSARPADWNVTSPEQQADDATALLAGLGLIPAAIFGTSSAAIFALAAVIRRPECVRGAVLHEPALFLLFDDPQDVRDSLSQLVKEAMEAGGPATALERFIRFAARGDGVNSPGLPRAWRPPARQTDGAGRRTRTVTSTIASFAWGDDGTGLGPEPSSQR